MDGSDDFPYDDVWSPALHEALFSASDAAQSWSSEPRQQYNTSPLPRQFHSQPTQSLNNLTAQNQRSDNVRPNSSSSLHPTVPTSITRKRSHLDPPNFPLQSDPVGFNTNSSGRPFNTPTFRSRPTTPLTRGLPRPVTPESLLSEDFFASGSSSRRSDTPWPDPEDYSEFVDLTADSSPPNMPPARHVSKNPRDASSAPSNPAKRRKTEASQSSIRTREIEEVDLRDVDEDNRLSKVLEQQRMATIRAQQEQANRPVKLSTLQCIICMESMTDLTATHCGKAFSVTLFLNHRLTKPFSRPSILSFMPHGSPHRRREPRLGARQRTFKVSRLSEESPQADRA